MSSPTIDLTDDTPVKKPSSRGKLVDLTHDDDNGGDEAKENNNVSRHFDGAAKTAGGHYKHKKTKKQILSGKDLEAYEKSQVLGGGVNSDDGLPGAGNDEDDESR